MRIDLACFTDSGQILADRLARALAEQGDAAQVQRCGGDCRVGDWAARVFARADALVFVGAAGIAVRAIAPHVADKTRDPAVVCIDDSGRFAVALLSGHIGGANDLARRLAALAGGTAVVTTATDVHGVFAVDVWAAANGYAIANPEAIKTVSARLLAGKTVTVACDFPVAGPLPPGLASGESPADMAISLFAPLEAGVLHIVPPLAALGIGCRRGMTAPAIDEAFLRLCRETRLSPLAVDRVVSIHLKRDEPGLIGFAAARGLLFRTYAAEELAAQDGEFSASAFVREVTGVDNVCERAAVAACGGGGRLLVTKTAAGGIAMAVAAGRAVVRFAAGDAS